MFKLLRRLQPTLTEPADLTKPTLNQFVVKMRERGLSAVSCKTRLKAVNVFARLIIAGAASATQVRASVVTFAFMNVLVSWVPHGNSFTTRALVPRA